MILYTQRGAPMRGEPMPLLGVVDETSEPSYNPTTPSSSDEGVGGNRASRDIMRLDAVLAAAADAAQAPVSPAHASVHVIGLAHVPAFGVLPQQLEAAAHEAHDVERESVADRSRSGEWHGLLSDGVVSAARAPSMPWQGMNADLTSDHWVRHCHLFDWRQVRETARIHGPRVMVLRRGQGSVQQSDPGSDASDPPPPPPVPVWWDPFRGSPRPPGLPPPVPRQPSPPLARSPPPPPPPPPRRAGIPPPGFRRAPGQPAPASPQKLAPLPPPPVLDPHPAPQVELPLPGEAEEAAFLHDHGVLALPPAPMPPMLPMQPLFPEQLPDPPPPPPPPLPPPPPFPPPPPPPPSPPPSPSPVDGEMGDEDGDAMAAHVSALRQQTSALGGAAASAADRVASRLQGTQHSAEGPEACAAVWSCWSELAVGSKARLAIGDYGLTMRAAARVRVPAGDGSANEEREAVELRGVRGVVVRAVDAWSADPGSTMSLGTRAGQERFGSLAGPAACIDTGCAPCANVAFRLRATAYGAEVRVVATRPIEAGRLLLAHYALACEGGRCPACDEPIAASWVGQREGIAPVAAGARRWQIKCGRVYEATGKPLEGVTLSGWDGVHWACVATASAPAGEQPVESGADVVAAADESRGAEDAAAASASLGEQPGGHEAGAAAVMNEQHDGEGSKRRGGLLKREAEKKRAGKAKQAAASSEAAGAEGALMQSALPTAARAAAAGEAV